MSGHFTFFLLILWCWMNFNCFYKASNLSIVVFDWNNKDGNDTEVVKSVCFKRQFNCQKLKQLSSIVTLALVITLCCKAVSFFAFHPCTALIMYSLSLEKRSISPSSSFTPYFFLPPLSPLVELSMNLFSIILNNCFGPFDSCSKMSKQKCLIIKKKFFFLMRWINVWKKGNCFKV